MDIHELLQEFTNSEQGQNATSALTEQGLSSEQVDHVLQESAGIVHAHVNEQGSGLLGAGFGRSKVGLDPSVVPGVVAAVTPFLTGFLAKKFSN